MASATGIELCPDSCLLAGIRPLRGGEAEISALRRLEGPSWPTQDHLVVEALRTARRDTRLPRRAFVVAWEFNERSAARPEPHDVLTSIEAAGFQIVSVLTPSEALRRLASTPPSSSRETAGVWLALNKCGAAIAIVRGPDLLYSRTFPWVYRDDLKAGRAQALQRYSLVAHLAPEITHGVDVVRAEHGVPIHSIVTCGDLPDLRSLTMPLIEELDLEVETLDSTAGLQLARNAGVSGFAESAPAIRLATAATLTSIQETTRDSLRPAFARAAAVMGLFALAWVGYAYWSRSDGPSRSEGATQESLPHPIATQGRREPNRAARAESPASDHRSQQSGRASSDKGTVAAPRSQPQPPPVPPLREPLPRIDTVLIDQDRRLALVEGGVVQVGDAIGSRVVVSIEPDSVVLREPSGRTVRVRVRSGTKS
jgi:hypothetical protein